jgi:hypothetical protein
MYDSIYDHNFSAQLPMYAMKLGLEWLMGLLLGLGTLELLPYCVIGVVVHKSCISGNQAIVRGRPMGISSVVDEECSALFRMISFQWRCSVLL